MEERLKRIEARLNAILALMVERHIRELGGPDRRRARSPEQNAARCRALDGRKRLDPWEERPDGAQGTGGVTWRRKRRMRSRRSSNFSPCSFDCR